MRYLTRMALHAASSAFSPIAGKTSLEKRVPVLTAQARIPLTTLVPVLVMFESRWLTPWEG
jgi:hypothetical protein